MVSWLSWLSGFVGFLGNVFKRSSMLALVLFFFVGVWQWVFGFFSVGNMAFVGWSITWNSASCNSLTHLPLQKKEHAAHTIAFICNDTVLLYRVRPFLESQRARWVIYSLYVLTLITKGISIVWFANYQYWGKKTKTKKIKFSTKNKTNLKKTDITATKKRHQ